LERSVRETKAGVTHRSNNHPRPLPQSKYAIMHYIDCPYSAPGWISCLMPAPVMVRGLRATAGGQSHYALDATRVGPAAFLQRSPDTATAEDIRRFQLHLAETATSICNRNRIMTGVRFLFRVTLRRLDLAAEIYHLREPQRFRRC
jgi:hypothetical protein